MAAGVLTQEVAGGLLDKIKDLGKLFDLLWSMPALRTLPDLDDEPAVRDYARLVVKTLILSGDWIPGDYDEAVAAVASVVIETDASWTVVYKHLHDGLCPDPHAPASVWSQALDDGDYAALACDPPTVMALQPAVEALHRVEPKGSIMLILTIISLVVGLLNLLWKIAKWLKERRDNRPDPQPEPEPQP